MCFFFQLITIMAQDLQVRYQCIRKILNLALWKSYFFTLVIHCFFVCLCVKMLNSENPWEFLDQWILGHKVFKGKQRLIFKFSWCFFLKDSFTHIYFIHPCLFIFIYPLHCSHFYISFSVCSSLLLSLSPSLSLLLSLGWVGCNS